MKTNINNALRQATHKATQNLAKSSMPTTRERERESKRRENLNSKLSNARHAQSAKMQLIKTPFEKSRLIKSPLAKTQCAQLTKSKQDKSTIALSVASVFCFSHLAFAQMPQDLAKDFDKNFAKDFRQDLTKQNMQNPQSTQEYPPRQNPQNPPFAMILAQIDSTQTDSRHNQNPNDNAIRNNAINNNANQKTYDIDSSQTESTNATAESMKIDSTSQSFDKPSRYNKLKSKNDLESINLEAKRFR
ncbi:hypothetical protein [Helicobacter sp. T3_23-1056]